MPRPASAIVIGGGVAGASIARWLSSRGVGVTVLENASLPGIAKTGPIALQSHGSAIEFTNVFVLELDD